MPNVKNHIAKNNAKVSSTKNDCDEMSNISNDNLSLFDKSVFKKPNEAKICMSEELKSSFINFQNVKSAIFSFKPTKTGGGEDEFRPIVLQNLNDMALQRLTKLYQAVVHLGYIPKIWRTAKVIFIAKSNKSTYENVRSFRPISLSSYLIKTLERLLSWQIENTALKRKQHFWHLSMIWNVLYIMVNTHWQ